MDEEIPDNPPQPAGAGPLWHALAEYSLPVGSVDPDPIHRWVVGATDGLHLPKSDLGKIQRATAGAALTLGGVGEAQTGRQPASSPPGGVAELRSEHGWGFFLVERMAPSARGGQHEPLYIIDLYLYQEKDPCPAPVASSGRCAPFSTD